MIVCPACAAENASGARFCSQCGTPLAGVAEAPARGGVEPPTRRVEGERRVVTILFCDVAGSTALAHDLDPEVWAEIMAGAFTRFTEPIRRYEGTVARIMGDAVLAFFGAPVAHEDDPRRAVLAGLGILRGIEAYRQDVQRGHGIDLTVRVGINTGLAIVGEVGTEQKMEYSAMGDAVNLAARMEQTAQPGTVQIAHDTYRRVARLFEIQPLGPIEVKGRPEPVNAYRVLGERPGAAPERGIEGLTAPLVGRAHELGLLRSSFEDLLLGRGQIVSVMGEAGIGKSRLLHELRQELQQRDIPLPSWHQGRSFSYETSIPYAPVVDLLRSVFSIDAGTDAGEAFERVRRAIEDVLPDRAMDDAAFVGWVLGIESDASAQRLRFLEPPDVRKRTFEAIRAYVAAVARRAPIVLAFEDLHWADSVSVDLLEELLAVTDEAMLMVLAVFRPQRTEPAWRFHEHAAREFGHRYVPIRLALLDASQSRELVGHLLHVEDLPESVRAKILAKAEGNPFYVEEVIRGLLDAGLIEPVGGRWRATEEIASIDVPETLAGVLTARIDRLDPAAKRLLQTASVIGREFAHEALEDVHEPAGDIERELSVLERRELIRLKSRIPAEVYLFQHVLIQEATYASLLRSRRRELHRRVAECLLRLAPDRIQDIARHYLAAEDPRSALPFMVRAGQKALGMYALTDASRWFEQALEAIDGAGQPTLARSIYESLGKARELQGDAAGALAAYDALYGLATRIGDAAMEVSALNKRAYIVGMHFGRLDESFELLDRAERRGREAADIPGLLEMSMIKCGACSATGRFGDALDYLGRSADMARDLDLQEPLAMSLAHLATTLVCKLDFAEAERRIQEAIPFFERIGDLYHLADLRAFPLPYLLLAQGDMEGALRAVLEGRDGARRIGVGFVEVMALVVLGGLEHARGAFRDAIGTYRQAIAAASDMGPAAGMFLPWLITGLWRASHDLDASAYQAAREEFDAAFAPLAAHAGAPSFLDLGEIALARGELDAADRYFVRALDTPGPRYLLERPRAWLGRAAVALARGDARGAECLATARTFVEEHGLAHFRPGLLVSEGDVHREAGDAHAALASYEAAERAAEPFGFRPWQARARRGAAWALRELGRHDDAAAAESDAERLAADASAALPDRGEA